MNRERRNDVIDKAYGWASRVLTTALESAETNVDYELDEAETLLFCQTVNKIAKRISRR